VTELVRVLPACTANGTDGSNAHWLLTRCSVVKEPGSLLVHTSAPEWGASQFSTARS